METVLKLFCDRCGCEFTRRAAEYRRNAKRGLKIYCSRRCSGGASNAHLSKYYGVFSRNLTAFSGNRRDKWTPFRRHLTRAKRRGYACSVTLPELEVQWNAQNGRCIYTGVVLQVPPCKGINDPLTTASLDRIDSTKGYILGNVQFVSVAANLAKNSMSHEQMLTFCETIAKYHRG